MTTDHRERRGFTLIELLASMGVFVLMAVFVFALTDATNRSARISTHAVDAATQARLALDRIGTDLANALQRPDAVFSPSDRGGNLLLFLSQVESANEPGWSTSASSLSSNRGASVVAYQIAASASNLNRLCLQRGALPFRWSDAGFMGLEQSDGSPIALPTPAAADFDVLAPGVIAMVVGFQLYPDNAMVNLAGANNTNPSPNPGSTPSQGQIVYKPPMRTDVGTAPYVDLNHVSAIVVGVIAIDLQNLQLLDASQVSTLAGVFVNPTATNTLPAQAWAPLAANVSSLPTSVPLPARQAVRVFQRFYPITPFARK